MNFPDGLDKSVQASASKHVDQWGFEDSDGIREISLRTLFQELVVLVSDHESKAVHSKLFSLPNCVFFGSFMVIVPCLGRLADGKPFLGTSTMVILSICLYWPSLFGHIVPSVGFLFCAIKD